MSDIRGVQDRPDRAVVAPRRRVYSDVLDFLRGGACRATVFEVCDAVGLEVSYRLRILEVNGQPGSGAARQSTAWQRWERRFGHPVLHIEAADLPDEVTLPFQIGATVLVPVCGWIPAGPLNLAHQAFESAFLLDKRPIGEGTLFMLKVVGDSMINAGIADGNWVVVRQQADANNGEIVAAMIDGDVTVKTLHRESGLLELVPQNPDYEPIPVAELTILGTVVGVVRQA